MDIKKDLQNEVLTVKVIGRLDTNTSPALETSLLETTDSYSKLVLDFSELEYISSAGLRILLSAQKRASAAGQDMLLLGVSDEVYEVLEITGFSDFLKVQRENEQ